MPSIAFTLPSISQIQNEIVDPSSTKISIVDVDGSPASNATLLEDNIDEGLEMKHKVYPTAPLNAISTSMTLLKAVVQLSLKIHTNTYSGGNFQYRD